MCCAMLIVEVDMAQDQMITVIVPREMHLELKRLAHREGRSMSAVVREACAMLIEQRLGTQVAHQKRWGGYYYPRRYKRQAK